MVVVVVGNSNSNLKDGRESSEELTMAPCSDVPMR